MSENRVLRRIFGLQRDEVTRGWRKLHNEEFHNLYSSPNIVRVKQSKRMRWVGHVWEMINNYKTLVRNPERRKPFERPRSRWENNVKMDLREIGCGGVDLIHLAEDRSRWQVLMSTIMNLRVALKRRGIS
jgi:hypothetical protein